MIKGTVSVFSNDPPCKDGIARYPNQVGIRYQWFFSILIFNFSTIGLHIFISGKHAGIFRFKNY